MSSPIFDATFRTGRFRHEEPVTTDPTTSPSPEPQDVRERFEAWERKRHVTALDRNPKGTWGDEAGEKYTAPFVQAAWEAWQAALAQSDAGPDASGLIDCPTDGVAARQGNGG